MITSLRREKTEVMKEVKERLEALSKDLDSPPPNQSATLVGTQSPSPEKSLDIPKTTKQSSIS